MEIIYFLLPLSLLLALVALAAFVWSVRAKQYDDVDAASVRMLFDADDPTPERLPDHRAGDEQALSSKAPEKR